MVQGPRRQTQHACTGVVARNKQNKAALRWSVRWPLGTHGEAGAHPLVIRLPRHSGLDLHSWTRRQDKKKHPSHWTQQGTDGIAVFVVKVVVVAMIEQSGWTVDTGTLMPSEAEPDR